jgi:NAD(P)H-nitrite reductase large subunit
MDECQDECQSDELHPAIRGLKTVCRCNNVKFRTIERCIRDGAVSVHQIAARTTATTGYCGGSCTPDIQQMIADLAPKAPPPPPKGGTAAPADAWWLRKK